MDITMTNQQSLIDTVWAGILIIASALITMMLPLELLAQGVGTVPNFNAGTGTGTGSSLDTLFCNVIGWFNGPIGKGIATIALIVVGVGALMGKVSWGMAIIVGIGVAIIFGATTLVDALGGAGSTDCDQGGMEGNKI